jgi:hypothetical protein
VEAAAERILRADASNCVGGRASLTSGPSVKTDELLLTPSNGWVPLEPRAHPVDNWWAASFQSIEMTRYATVDDLLGVPSLARGSSAIDLPHHRSDSCDSHPLLATLLLLH